MYYHLISSYLLPHTLTSFIPTAKHINAVASSSIILFISTYPIVYGILIKVYWCTSSHFPHLFLFVHLSINRVSSFVSISTSEALLLHKTSTRQRIESLLDHDDCACSPFIVDDGCGWHARVYPSDMSCNFDAVSWSAYRSHRIFNRPRELPWHHVLYILTFVVFGV